MFPRHTLPSTYSSTVACPVGIGTTSAACPSPPWSLFNPTPFHSLSPCSTSVRNLPAHGLVSLPTWPWFCILPSPTQSPLRTESQPPDVDLYQLQPSLSNAPPPCFLSLSLSPSCLSQPVTAGSGGMGARDVVGHGEDSGVQPCLALCRLRVRQCHIVVSLSNPFFPGGLLTPNLFSHRSPPRLRLDHTPHHTGTQHLGALVSAP